MTPRAGSGTALDRRPSPGVIARARSKRFDGFSQRRFPKPRREWARSLAASFAVVFGGIGGWADPLIPVAPDKVIRATRDTPDNKGPTSPGRVLPGERPTRKSYVIPSLEIPAFILVLNGYDRLVYGPEVYGVTPRTIRDHALHGPWVVDQDSFAINQIGHPYQGAMYYGFARSANLNYWEGLLYSNAGSLLWETAGERSDPSLNDQVASGTAGSFIGEALFRLANLVLEEGGPAPNRWRKLAAGVISPPTMLNRILFGDRYGPVLESRHPALASCLALGVGFNATDHAAGSGETLARAASYADYRIAYGLPGKPGYRYLRPFDYFDFEIDSIAESGRQYNSAMIRGLLFGAPYGAGDDYRGVWGLYGTFDYLSPQVYRLSTTAASFGTTAQWWLSERLALQGTALAGLGYGSVGTILPTLSEADFHYGVSPQQLLALRLIMGNRFSLDASGRNVFITGVGAGKAPGHELVQHVTAGLSVRTFGRQAIALGYMLGRRKAHYSGGLQDRDQTVRTVTLTYNFLGRARLGAVEWGNNQLDD